MSKKQWTLEAVQGLGLKVTGMPVGVDWQVKSLNEAKQKQAGIKEQVQALGRLKDGAQNKTEAAYGRLLEARKQGGEILKYWFGVLNIRLAAKCYYKIDYLVLTASGHLEVHEVKGKWEDDALVKIKAAAELLPFKFIACRLVKGVWEYRYF